MSKKLVIPTFASEAEDAAWHDRHKKEIDREIVRRMKAGTVILKRKKRELSARNRSRKIGGT